MKQPINKYGWKPSLPDHRDFKYKVDAPIPLPDVVDLSRKELPIYNQLNIGSCTSQAIAGVFRYKKFMQTQQIFNPSRLFIYWNERAFEGTIKIDSGATLRDGIKVLNRIGVCHEDLWDYNPAKFRNEPPSPCFVEGLKNRINSYESIDNTNLFMLQQCLAKGNPIVLGFSVYESFESEETARTGIVQMPDRSESFLGGHGVAMYGYNIPEKTFKVANSWGESWGDQGYFHVPFEYFTNPNLASDFWAVDAV